MTPSAHCRRRALACVAFPLVAVGCALAGLWIGPVAAWRELRTEWDSVRGIWG